MDENAESLTSNPLGINGQQPDRMLLITQLTAALHRTAQSDQEVFIAFYEGLAKLNLAGMIFELEDDGETLSTQPAATSLETMDGALQSQTLGLRISTASSTVLSQTIKDGSAQFIPNVDILFQAVAEAHQSHQIQDFRNQPCICAPLITEQDIGGVVLIAGEILEPEDCQVIEAIAAHLAIAFENARKFTYIRQSEARYHTLVKASTDAVFIEDYLEKVLENILTRLAEVIPYDSATVFLLEGDRLHGQAARGLPSPEEVVGKYFSADNKLFQIIRRTGEALILDDASTHHDFECWGDTNYVFGWMGVPLIVKGLVIGYLTCDKCETNAYQPEDATLAQAFANQAATAIENARLFEAERAQLLQAQTLQEVGALLTTQLSLNEVLEKILDLLGRVVQYDSTSIQLINASGRLTLAAGRGFESISVTGQIVEDLSDNMLERKLADHKVVVIPDTHHDERWSIVPGTEYIRSWVGAPLLVRGNLIGCLNVDSRTENAYNDGTGETVMAFAQQAAIAIENARLFEQAMTERRHLRLRYDISREMAHSLNPDEILKCAITLISQALNGMVGQAYTHSADEEFLRLRAIYGREPDALPTIEGIFTLPRDVGLVGWVARNHKSVYAPDVSQDPYWTNFPGIDDDVEAALVAPILAGERLFGVLTVFHHQTEAFSDEHLELLEAICQEVALALSNVERYQQIQRLSNILQDQQRQLQSLVDHMPAGVLLLDSELNVLVMNPLGHEMLLALNAKEIDIAQKLERVGPVSIHDLMERANDALPIEITLDETPKLIFAIQLRATDHAEGSPQSQWVLTISDITQERENLSRIQIQERLATVGQLAAGIAHDFNNIMATILIYTDLMRLDTSIQSDSREKLGIIKHQIQRATSLIRQILDFSRKSVMEQSTLDLLPLVKELDKILGRTLPETIQLELSFEPESYWIMGDPTRLQQIFMNLAVNARDAMPEGGTLRITLENIYVSPSMLSPIPDMPPGNWVKITITDTGTGIPPEVQEHIFEPFFTTKSVDQGTGLGLAQVYGIVKQHDGYIDFYSRVGSGTTFRIYLPVLSVDIEMDSPPDTGPMLNGNGLRVMVVEDDYITRDALEALLTAHGFAVKLARNGVEALELLDDGGKVDLIVSDVVMPKMGGLDLYTTLQERKSDTKMLLITGHPIQEENHALLEQGDIDWLQKPFSAYDFKQLLSKLLGI